MHIRYREILPGINLRVVQTKRFKTACFSASFLTKINHCDAAMNALYPQVLRRGTRLNPDMMQLSSALDLLYGARVEPEVRKFGDVQLSGVVCDLVTPRGVSENILEKTLSLALEILLDPLVVNESFNEEYVESEKENLIDYLNGEINEKLSFAYKNAIGSFYKDSGFGVYEYGEVSDVALITPKALYKHYKNILATAPLEIFFCGDASFEQVEESILPCLKKLARKETSFTQLGKPKAPEKNDICVRYDVNQANLLIGFYAGIKPASEMQPALQVMAAVLGGGVASKLFAHVREEKSLCYYTGARYDKFLQTVFMYSGVAPDKTDEAYKEMMNQLKDCCEGKISEEELQAAKRHIVDNFKTTGDTALSLESYWIGESVLGLSRDIDERIAKICEVTVDDAVMAANELLHCMNYVLTEKEVPYARKSLPRN